MRLFYLTLCALTGLQATAQEAPPITDQLLTWGELLQDQQNVGHYSITSRQDERQKTAIFTVSLYSSNLQPVGEKTYPPGEDTDVQDVAYNGTHLGVLIHDAAGKRSRVEVLDQTARTVATYPLQGQTLKTSGELYATPDGFVVVNSFPIQPGLPVSNTNYVVEKVVTQGSGTGWIRRYGSPEASSTDIRLAVAALDEEVLLIRVWDLVTKTFSRKVQSAVYALDLATGADRFSEIVETQRAAEAPTFIGAARVGTGYKLLRLHPARREKRIAIPATLNVLTYRADRLVDTKTIDLPAAVGARLREQHLAPLPPQVEFVYRVGLITPTGAFSLVLEPFTAQGRNVTYTSPYVVAVDSSGRLQDLTVLRHQNFVLPATLTNPQQLNTLRMYDGPFNHALSHQLGPRNYHYVLDRSFARDGVTYLGINATVFDGEGFVTEYIPLRDTDYLRLYPAREGYLCVLEPKFGEGKIVPRLEKLNY